MRRRIAPLFALAMLSAGAATGQALPAGAIVADVKCVADPAQSYALYLPSDYSSSRSWPVLLGFHPAARGRAIVEKYRAAAERYGYIVAASNTSRNGSWAISGAAVAAMSADLVARFPIDPRRVYLTGLSGGARVALAVALGTSDIAGVIASSAGYPDDRPRTRLKFPMFSTAGTEDFNYLEMRTLDRRLETPHYLAVFTGGHTLPPDTVAMDAIEWMDLQAMKSGRRVRDEAAIDRLLAKRREAIAAAGDSPAAVHLLEAVAADFEGLRDVAADAARAKALAKQPDVRKALARERSDEDAESRMLRVIVDLEARLPDDTQRQDALRELRGELSRLSRKASDAEDSPARSQARRVLRAVTAGASERVQDREYLAMLQALRR